MAKRVGLGHDIQRFSNAVKFKTTIDLFDWIAIIIFFGGFSVLLLLAFIAGKISIENLLSGFVLWFTAYAILKYTKETYHLKKVQQYQLDESRKQTFLLTRPFIRLQWRETDQEIRIINEGEGMAIALVLQFSHGGLIKRAMLGGEKASKSYTDAGVEDLLKRTDVMEKSDFDAMYSPKIQKYNVTVSYTDVVGNFYVQEFRADETLNDKFKLIEWDIPKDLKSVEMRRVKIIE